MAEETRRLAAILSIDAVGYSRLMGSDEAGAHELFRRHRNDNILPALERHSGRIVNTAGDGFLVEFASAVNAVSAGLAMLEGIGRTNRALPPGRAMEFRVGVNLGEVIVENADLFGTEVNIAARIESLAQPGDMLATRAVRDQAEGRVAAEFAAYGTHRVKNIATPIEVYRVTLPGAPPRPMPPERRRRISGLAGVLAAAAAILLLAWLDPFELQHRFDIAAEQTVRPTIAVLPFANQTGDADSDYLTEAFAEDISNGLGRYGTLTVLSHTAAAAWRARPATPTEIGRALKSRYLVEGTIRQGGTQRRISARLVDAESGALLWTGAFDAAAPELLAAHDAIVREVAGALAARVVQVEGARSAGRPEETLAAYELLLRARAALGRGTRAGHVEARGLLDRAIATDPKYAELHVSYAQLLYERSQRGWTQEITEGFEQAEQMANRALEIDPNAAGAFAQLARIHVAFGRYDEALAAADRAIARNPSDPLAQYARAAVMLWLGRPAEAVTGIVAMQRIEPQLGPEALFVLGCAHLLSGKYRQAQALIDGNLSRFPDYAYLHLVLAAAQAELGERDKAALTLAEMQRYDPFFDVARFGSRFRQAADRERIVASLRKAGLK